MGKIEFRQIRFYCDIWDGNLLPRKAFHRSLVIVSDGTQINMMITHGCKNFEEKEKKMGG